LVIPFACQLLIPHLDLRVLIRLAMSRFSGTISYSMLVGVLLDIVYSFLCTLVAITLMSFDLLKLIMLYVI
jgi:hypothetical protein